jgi:biopolymer transport protein ExbD
MNELHPARTLCRLTIMGGWVNSVAPLLIRLAARSAPESLSERLEEEWLAHLTERRGPMSRLSFALGCYWAAIVIPHDPCPVQAPAPAATTTRDVTIMAYAYRGTPLFARRAAASQGPVLCDINITPLIDVMLVLLVTLIVTLPIMTHAVKMDMPRGMPPLGEAPEAINVDIDFDGTVVWNGQVVSWQQLESYLRTEAHKEPQAEIHLRADRHVKYDYVAKVLALAQHNRMSRMGFVNTADFTN